MELLFTNSYFKKKATTNDIAYNTGFHATPELRAVLGHAQNRQVKLTKKEYTATVVLGKKSYTATFYLSSYEPDVYVGHLYINEYSIDIYDKKLTEFSWPLSGSWADQWQNSLDKVWPQTDIWFPGLVAYNFYDDPESLIADRTKPDFFGLLNENFGGPQQNYIGTDGRAKNKYTVVPQPSLLSILRMCVHSIGYRIDGDFVRDESVRRMFIHSNKSLDFISPPETLVLGSASNNTTWQYTLNGVSQHINLIDTDSTYHFNVATNYYTIKTHGKHSIEASLDFTHATGAVSGIKLVVYKETSASVFTPLLESTVSTEPDGRLTINTDFVIQQHDLNYRLYFAIEGTSPNSSTKATITGFNVTIDASGNQYFEVASRTTDMIYDFSPGADIDIQHASTSDVSILSNHYTIPHQGILRVLFRFTYYAANIPAVDMRIFKNGTQFKSATKSNVDAVAIPNTNMVSITAEWEFNTYNIVGDTLTFRVQHPTDPGVNMAEVDLEFEYTDGLNKLVNYFDPTDLNQLVPAITFGRFLDAILQRGIGMDVNPIEKVIYFNIKENLSQSQSYFDLSKAPFSSGTKEFSQPDLPQLYKYDLYDEDNPDLPTEYAKLLLYNNDNEWSVLSADPSDIKFEEQKITLHPLPASVQFPTEVNPLNYPGPSITTLETMEEGFVHNDSARNRELSTLYFGIYQPLTTGINTRTPIARYTDGFIDITLDPTNIKSLLHKYVAWKQYLDTLPLQSTYTFYHILSLPSSLDKIIFKKQSFIWQEARITYSVNKPVEVELLLR
ncbi:hypothetical protein [Owenweeksia hongkongensis]|nr:hypothetical protein [Owenweeksia hongkongensis]